MNARSLSIISDYKLAFSSPFMLLTFLLRNAHPPCSKHYFMIKLSVTAFPAGGPINLTFKKFDSYLSLDDNSHEIKSSASVIVERSESIVEIHYPELHSPLIRGSSSKKLILKITLKFPLFASASSPPPACYSSVSLRLAARNVIC